MLAVFRNGTYRQGGPGQSGTLTGGSENENGKGKKEKGNGKGKNKGKWNSTSSTPNGSPQKPSKDKEDGESTKNNGGTGGEKEGQEPSVAKVASSNNAGDTGGLVSEVTSLLKSIRLQGGPQIKAYNVMKIGDKATNQTLLDAWRSHSLPANDGDKAKME